VENVSVLWGGGEVHGLHPDGTPAREIQFGSIVIDRDAHITGKGIVVKTSLELRDSSKLSPVSGDRIGLFGGVSVKLIGDTVRTLPLLNLGQIGSKYDILPSVIMVDIGRVDIGDGERQLIVKGRTFGNCESWMGQLSGLPKSLEGHCEAISPARAGAAAEGEEIGLFVMKRKGDSNQNVDRSL
jgi:hypothetical protein